MRKDTFAAARDKVNGVGDEAGVSGRITEDI